MFKLSQFARISGEFTKPPYKIVYLDLGRKGVVSHFARQIESGMNQGYTAFKLRFPSGKYLYPNRLVPLAGVIDYYQGKGISFLSSHGLESNAYLGKAGLLAPFDDPSLVQPLSHIDKIWKFSSDTHYEVIDGIMSSIRAQLMMEKGVMYGLELCLNEITDNVLNHSLGDEDGEPYGFVMAQVHNRNHRVAISVFDAGIGIFQSLRSAYPEIEDPQTAIGKALTKGVTSGMGRGNGLWILNQIVFSNGGSLEITSDTARYVLIADTPDSTAIASYSKATRLAKGSTHIDFQLDASHPLDLPKALDGLSTTNLWLESREEADERNVRLLVKNESIGCGSRVAAKRMRILVENVARETSGDIILDFDGVNLVSTSYADELIVKLCADEALATRIVLANLNEECARLIGEVLTKPIRVWNCAG